MNSALFTVSGRVQGVGFRYFVQGMARRIGLSGFVRNLPDGRVECGARGSEGQLRELEAILHQGPPASLVSDVSRRDGIEIPQGDRFEITY